MILMLSAFPGSFPIPWVGSFVDGPSPRSEPIAPLRLFQQGTSLVSRSDIDRGPAMARFSDDTAIPLTARVAMGDIGLQGLQGG